MRDARWRESWRWFTSCGENSWSYIGGSPGTLSNLPSTPRYSYRKKGMNQSSIKRRGDEVRISSPSPLLPRIYSRPFLWSPRISCSDHPSHRDARDPIHREQRKQKSTAICRLEWSVPSHVWCLAKHHIGRTLHRSNWVIQSLEIDFIWLTSRRISCGGARAEWWASILGRTLTGWLSQSLL